MSMTASGLKVHEGEPIPSVGLRASNGYLLNLRSFVGKQPAIFLFFEGPSVAGAGRERGDALARALKEAQPRVHGAGVALVAISTDSEKQQAAYVAEMELPFLLFCDERRSAVDLLGVPTTADGGNINAMPTAFAVAVDGTIVDIVERPEPRGLIARLLESIQRPG
jgi:peroxiredoxin